MKPASGKPNQVSGRQSPETPVIEPGLLPMVEVEGSTHVLSFVNDRFCRLLGQPAVELLGKTFAEIAPGGASCVPMLDRAYQPGSGTNGDVEAPDSSSGYWVCATWPAPEPDKMPERVVIHLTKATHSHQNMLAMNEALLVGALRQHELREEAENKSVQLRKEIAERQTAENALRESEAARNASAERFLFLAESMPQKIFTAKRSGEMDYFNGPWMEYTHLSFEQIRDSGWIQFIHRDEVDEGLRRWTHSIESGDDFEWEHRIRRHDGVFRWHLTRAHAMRDAAGAVLMWSGSSTDIDEARRTMEEVARTGRAKDDFLAALSHELRTPLTPALMTISALREDERLPREAREQLAMAERNILLEARLIDDLLDITKISHGKLQLRAQSCDAHHLIRFAIEIVRDEARLKGVSLECALNAHRSGLIVDPTRFQQVVWNLLRNALKFTPTGGRISITTRDEKTPEGEDWLRIEVTDTGIGIAPARLVQIFQPFDQGGLTGDHRFGGVGLGLAIARAVVDLHGGRIGAQSPGPGHGSTFTVELPGASESRVHEKNSLSSSSGPWEPTLSATKIPREIQPLRLLVVEDHESTLQTLRLLLQRDGHTVVTSSTVAKALADAAADQFDLVISDLGLPDGTGLKLMKELATLYDLRGIALSGYGTEEDISHSRQAGFIDHLVKPISLSDLRRAVASFYSLQKSE